MGGAEWDNHPSSTRPTSQSPNYLPTKVRPTVQCVGQKKLFFLFFSMPPRGTGTRPLLDRSGLSWWLLSVSVQATVVCESAGWTPRRALLQNVLRAAAASSAFRKDLCV